MPKGNEHHQAGTTQFGARAEPCVLVIVGASGDLTHRKLLPALYALAHNGSLPDETEILGCARTPKSDEQWREELRASCEKYGRLKPSQDLWEDFAKRLRYRTLDPATEEGGQQLREELEAIDGECATCGNRIYYMSTPPSAYEPVLRGLSRAGLLKQQEPDESPFFRVVIEKPFGHDLASARALHATTHEVMHEHQLYRIDHYLGKETVQNIMVLRFANAIFEPVWNNRYIEYVEITAAETQGVAGRGKFYEEAGILRDIVQNHMLQVLSLVAMEPPVSYAADHVRDERAQVLKSLRPFKIDEVDEHVVRGQYGPGTVGGERVCGYHEEPGVNAQSVVPTYMAMRVDIDNWRWSGVPFYLRAGKRLAKKLTEVAIHFRDVPFNIFSKERSYARPNVLTCRLQPDEGVHMQFAVKVPGDEMSIRPQDMDFSFGEAFGDDMPDAYERLLLDSMEGDPMLFARRDSVELAWEYVEPILESWERRKPDRFPDYAAGSWGPRHADQLLAKDGRIWREP